jgi:hypothetical protein
MIQSVVLVFTCLLGLALGSCSGEKEQPSGGKHSEHASLDHAPMEAGEPTDYSHSNIITLVDRQEELVYQQMKLRDQPVNAIQTIKA